MTSTSDEVVHTATPWKVYRTTDGLLMLGIGQASTGDGITDPRFGLWCSDAERDANAAFIVRAVNSHDSLVKALEASRSFVEISYDENGGEEAADAKHVMDQIDAALSQAKGVK